MADKLKADKLKAFDEGSLRHLVESVKAAAAASGSGGPAAVEVRDAITQEDLDGGFGLGDESYEGRIGEARLYVLRGYGAETVDATAAVWCLQTVESVDMTMPKPFPSRNLVLVTQTYLDVSGDVRKRELECDVTVGSLGSLDVKSDETLATTDQLPNVATADTPGLVKPDGTTITVAEDGTIGADLSELDNVKYIALEASESAGQVINDMYFLKQQNPLVPYKRLGAKGLNFPEDRTTGSKISGSHVGITLRFPNTAPLNDIVKAFREKEERTLDALLHDIYQGRDASISFPMPIKMDLDSASDPILNVTFSFQKKGLTDGAGKPISFDVGHDKLGEFVEFGHGAAEYEQCTKIPKGNVLQFFFVCEDGRYTGPLTFKEYMGRSLAQDETFVAALANNRTFIDALVAALPVVSTETNGLAPRIPEA